MQISKFYGIPAFRWHNDSMTNSRGTRTCMQKAFKLDLSVCKFSMWQRRAWAKRSAVLIYQPNAEVPRLCQCENRHRTDQMWTCGDRYVNVLGYAERCEGAHTVHLFASCWLIILRVIRDELTRIWFLDFFREATRRKPRCSGVKDGWNRHWQEERNYTAKRSMLHCCEALNH